MNENYIIEKLILHGIHFNLYGFESDKQAFTTYMHQLQILKEFTTIEEACNYFCSEGN